MYDNDLAVSGNAQFMYWNSCLHMNFKGLLSALRSLAAASDLLKDWDLLLT